MGMIGGVVGYNRPSAPWFGARISRASGIQTAIDYGSCENYNLHCAIVLEYVSYICDA